MRIRLKITLLFSLLAFLILGLVCCGIYYFSYQARAKTIETRLTNRAITTARLLSERETFDQSLVAKIDAFTTVALKDKTVQAYDEKGQKVYSYSDVPADTLKVDPETLDEARTEGKRFFAIGRKEVIAYYYNAPPAQIVVVTAAEDVEGKQNLARLFKILSFSFLAGNVLILVAGYIFSGRLLRPIRKIAEEVAEISAQSFTRRIPEGTSKDEWQQLAATINDLLDRLQESFELQQRFIANASHELSTPLTSISSQLQVSMQRERGANDYKNAMQSVYEDVQHMIKLTQTLLEFAKASGSKSGIQIDLVRMDEVVLKLPADVNKVNPTYSVSVAFHDLPDEEERLLVYGNELLLSTAIKNMVINACKYAPDQSASVGLYVINDTIEIRVEDNGPGIPHEDLGYIFEPFYRGNATEPGGGFGLGLPLAQRIIKMHKGGISVLPREQQGSTFAIRLPAAGSYKQTEPGNLS